MMLHSPIQTFNFLRIASFALAFCYLLSYPVLQFDRRQLSSFLLRTTAVGNKRGPTAIARTDAGIKVCDSSRQFCVDPIQGSWIHKTQRSFHAPTCCAWDAVDFEQALTDVCGTHQWSMSRRYKGANKTSFPVQTGGRACARGLSTNFSDHYVWQSPSMDQEDFSADKTCRLLGKRKVLVVGDSTGQQYASTLMNALQLAKAATCAPQIFFSLSDTLVLRGKDRGFHISDEVSRIKPDICIFSLGPHIYGQDLFQSIFEEVLANITTIQRRQRADKVPVTQFVYRTQHPGGCTEKISALGADDAGRAINSTWSNYRTMHSQAKHAYNYADFYDRDLFAISRLQEAGIPYLDMRMLYIRSDAHALPPKDCLHFASPGALDIVPPMFQNFLLHSTEAAVRSIPM